MARITARPDDSTTLRPAAAELAAVFKALGDLTRIRMMSLLLSAGPEGLCVCDIGAYFPQGQPTVSHHLRLLKDSGLVSATRKGLWVYYAAAPRRLEILGISLPMTREPVRRSTCGDDGLPDNSGAGPTTGKGGRRQRCVKPLRPPA